MNFELNFPQLLRNELFINGEWIAGNDRFPVYNPADQQVIGEIPNASLQQIESAIRSAHMAGENWATRSGMERKKILSKWHDLVIEHEKDLARILTIEQGKPFREALGEIRYGASFIDWFASEAVRNYGDVLMPTRENNRMHVIKQPIGTVAAITPWNFPNAMITRKIAPALAAGCSVVIKPSEETPFSALALAYLAQQAGIPNGVLNVIFNIEPWKVGEVFTTHPLIRKLSFTGSTVVGKWLAERASANLKKISLELGGNAPFIIFEDADLDRAVHGVISSKFRNNGQTCICTNRILVHSLVEREFIHKLKRKMTELTVGSGLERGVDLGPLINIKALGKISEIQKDALEKGATIEQGGQLKKGLFYEPTLLSGGNRSMKCFTDEIFGPIAVTYPFNSDEEALNLANSTDYGLAAYFYTRSIERVHRISEGLEFGMVGVNTAVISDATAPFGGIKNSGQGREGSRYGMDEYLSVKLVALELHPVE
ncbi:MAG: NAD-dependent succinate-semialdehyde dehydrogenase [Flavobacteriales bacterium]|nr:NAD-dependent succinate-semialdehyde dehydrogenase [Flavobacteriales bacterium]